jgi:hypothetical protein
MEAAAPGRPPPPPRPTPTRYGVLRAASRVLGILSWIVLVVGGVVVVVGGAITIADGLLRGLLFLVGGALLVAFLAFALVASGELLRLLLDVERSTRRTAEEIAARR